MTHQSKKATHNLNEHSGLKATLRDYFRQKRAFASKASKICSKEAEQHFLKACETGLFGRFEAIGAYIPILSEFRLNFEEIAKSLKVPLYFPSINAHNLKGPELLWFDSSKNLPLERTKLGTMEPSNSIVDSAFHSFQKRKDEIWLVFVPCLAASIGAENFGFRLGYGGGFYDSFLAAHKKNAISIALNYSDCLVNSLPIEAHDERVDFVLSEKGIFEKKNLIIEL